MPVMCARTGGVVWRRVIFAAVALLACSHGSLLMPSAALGADASTPAYKSPPPPAPEWSRYYVGAAVNWVHHTGYVPGSARAAEWYSSGGKVFGGYRFTETISFEAAYHYLGKVPFDEGLALPSHERSYAVSGSAVFLSPALWTGPTNLPIHGFLRLGLAYKDITHQSVVGTFHEGVLSVVLGAGLEF